MGIATLILTLCGVGLLGWIVFVVRAARADARSAREGVQALLDAFRKGHGYGDPSAAAVVVPSPSPAPVTVEPEPALTRSLPAESMVERRALPSIPPGLSRPFRPSAEDITIAREAHEKAEIRRRVEAREDARHPAGWERETSREGDRAALRPLPPDVAEALGAPATGTAVIGLSVDEADGADVARSGELHERESGARAISLETLARLDESELARIDALAAKRGISRDEMIEILIERGADAMMRESGPMPPRGPTNS